MRITCLNIASFLQECPPGTYKNTTGSDMSLCYECPSSDLPRRAFYVSVRGYHTLSFFFCESTFKLLCETMTSKRNYQYKSVHKYNIPSLIVLEYAFVAMAVALQCYCYLSILTKFLSAATL